MFFLELTTRVFTCTTYFDRKRFNNNTNCRYNTSKCATDVWESDLFLNPYHSGLCLNNMCITYCRVWFLECLKALSFFDCSFFWIIILFFKWRPHVIDQYYFTAHFSRKIICSNRSSLRSSKSVVIYIVFKCAIYHNIYCPGFSETKVK